MLLPVLTSRPASRTLNPANRNRLVDHDGNWFSWGGPETDGGSRNILRSPFRLVDELGGPIVTALGRYLNSGTMRFVDELGNPWIWGVPSASGAIVTSIDAVALITSERVMLANADRIVDETGAWFSWGGPGSEGAGPDMLVDHNDRMLTSW